MTWKALLLTTFWTVLMLRTAHTRYIVWFVSSGKYIYTQVCLRAAMILLRMVSTQTL